MNEWMDALKSLWDKLSQYLAYLGAGGTWLSFLIQIMIFLGLGTASDILLHPGILSRIYLVLFKPFILVESHPVQV